MIPRFLDLRKSILLFLSVAACRDEPRDQVKSVPFDAVIGHLHLQVTHAPWYSHASLYKRRGIDNTVGMSVCERKGDTSADLCSSISAINSAPAGVSVIISRIEGIDIARFYRHRPDFPVRVKDDKPVELSKIRMDYWRLSLKRPSDIAPLGLDGGPTLVTTAYEWPIANCRPGLSKASYLCSAGFLVGGALVRIHWENSGERYPTQRDIWVISSNVVDLIGLISQQK